MTVAMYISPRPKHWPVRTTSDCPYCCGTGKTCGEDWGPTKTGNWTSSTMFELLENLELNNFPLADLKAAIERHRNSPRTAHLHLLFNQIDTWLKALEPLPLGDNPTVYVA